MEKNIYMCLQQQQILVQVGLTPWRLSLGREAPVNEVGGPCHLTGRRRADQKHHQVSNLQTVLKLTILIW